MNKTFALLRLIAPALPLIAGVQPAFAAAPAAAPATTAAPAAAPMVFEPSKADDIIPLPLSPVVPAALRSCTAKTASGLGTMQLKAGQGAKPVKGDYVLVSYIGFRASNGAVFDQGVGAAFPVEGVIPGFSEGLQQMNKGSIARLCVPAALGYGDKGTGPIPPKSDLVFQVELIDFKSEAEIEALRKQRDAQGASAGAPTEQAPAPKAN